MSLFQVQLYFFARVQLDIWSVLLAQHVRPLNELLKKSTVNKQASKQASRRNLQSIDICFYPILVHGKQTRESQITDFTRTGLADALLVWPFLYFCYLPLLQISVHALVRELATAVSFIVAMTKKRKGQRLACGSNHPDDTR